VGDTSNWEFAATVAAVTMGLAGLLVFTIGATVGSWRVFGRAGRAASEAAKAAIAVQDLARYLSVREAMLLTQSTTPTPTPPPARAADGLADLRAQAQALMQQQARLRDALRNLVDADVLRSDDSAQQLRELEAAIRRLDDNVARVDDAISRLGQRPA